MPSKKEEATLMVPSDEQRSPLIYLDHNATTPLDPSVLDAMLPYLTTAFGNAASRTHKYGQRAEHAVEAARSRVASLIGATSKEIVWTSGATESNNLAIKGIAAGNKERGRHIITQATEHNAVLDPCEWLKREGFEVTVLPVDRQGTITVQSVKEAVRPDTILVSIMWANNETGTLQPIGEVGALCRERRIAFHTDATQAVGKIPVDVRRANVDALSLSAHKFYGPKGVGALFVRQQSPRLKLSPLLHGGGHERGLRSGTINVPGVVGAGAASEMCARYMRAESLRLAKLRDSLEGEIQSRLSDVRVNGDLNNRLPHTTNLTFGGIDAEGLLVAMADVALSTGSACTSASVKPSHVLTAMGLSPQEVYASIRLGLGRSTTAEEVRHVATRICETVEMLRELRRLA